MQNFNRAAGPANIMARPVERGHNTSELGGEGGVWRSRHAGASTPPRLPCPLSLPPPTPPSRLTLAAGCGGAQGN
eukprot:COSAG04_NODE_24860_length_316_cov_0.506912_1_plen_74_part_10